MGKGNMWERSGSGDAVEAQNKKGSNRRILKQGSRRGYQDHQSRQEELAEAIALGLTPEQYREISDE